MIRKILLATDGSEHALNAARFAGQLAKSLNAEVTILHVIYIPLEEYGVRGLRIVDPEIRNEAQKNSEELIAKTKTLLQESGIEATTVFEFGHPGQTIAQRVAAEHHDLVVMGSRGLTDLEGSFLGSVSHQVLHNAKCPVLIVK